jgi:murein DD-endopeptidase MepM/ murein hydrolase activator NlpD
VKLLVLFSAPLVAVLALIFSVVIVLDPAAAPATAAACTPSTPSAIRGIRLDKQQLRVATQIIQVGRRLHVPPRGWVVGLATAMQESGLRPLPFGDRDSLGVFQQRSSWSTTAARLDPVRSAEMFYTGGQAGQSGLLDVKGWKRLAVTEAAQAVQRSAYPDAYARWEPLAVALVKRLAHIDASCPASGGWSSPLGNASYVLTAGFGDCGRHWSHCHTGQDFAVPTGTPVTSVGGGVVTFAGWDGAYGSAVHVLHADSVAT